MSFDQFIYERPDMKQLSNRVNTLLDEFDGTQNIAHLLKIITQINAVKSDFMTMYNLAYIRHTTNTHDEFYEKENAFFDAAVPEYDALNNHFFKRLLNHPQKEALEKKLGSQLFKIAEQSLKTFSDDVLEDLKLENELGSKYIKLKATAVIDVEGKNYNLSSIYALEVDNNRATRKKAVNKKWDFYRNNQEKIDDIFDQLVKVRHKIALKLGFENFIELGYARMLRTDYNEDMVKIFRQEVLENIVPVAKKLYQRQAKRLNLENLHYYDENFQFLSGNAKPVGSPEEIIDNAAQMYHELSEETSIFFDFMRKNKLMNLLAKDGKSTGGYCTFIENYQAPFIFSNFNGTSADIDVLTHEAGHAFQVFSSKDTSLIEYNWPTYEACEIHSMSMEYFAWPWMELFFKENADKYRFAHMVSSLLFLPYGVAVDEFQHFIYKNPYICTQERHEAWRNIEKKYLPHKTYDSNDFLEKGGYWQKQSHIFVSPFYYIDYALASACAFQFWKKDRANHDEAWNDYLRLCKAGGSRSFLELVKLANLKSPFEKGTLKSLVKEIEQWLLSVNDQKL